MPLFPANELQVCDPNDPTKIWTFDLSQLPTATVRTNQPPAGNGAISTGGGGGGSATVGVATIAFATWKNEDSITVTGQAGLTDSSRIWASVYADNGEVALEQWDAPIIQNVIAGIGFTLLLRPKWKTFRGPVKLNWGWQ